MSDFITTMKISKTDLWCVPQPGKCTKNHRIIYLKWMNYIICKNMPQ